MTAEDLYEQLSEWEKELEQTVKAYQIHPAEDSLLNTGLKKHTEKTQKQLDVIRAAMEFVADRSWCPVEEGLPSTNRYVLLSPERTLTPFIAYHSAERKGWYDDDSDKSLADIGIKVNAWMELPEPYRGGKA